MSAAARRRRFGRRQHQVRELDRRFGPREAPRCPVCDRVMTFREADEQGACNDCSGGAYAP